MAWRGGGVRGGHGETAAGGPPGVPVGREGRRRMSPRPPYGVATTAAAVTRRRRRRRCNEQRRRRRLQEINAACSQLQQQQQPATAEPSLVTNRTSAAATTQRSRSKRLDDVHWRNYVFAPAGKICVALPSPGSLKENSASFNRIVSK